ncbi:MAG TPA: hypothetical protein VGQ36_14125 [Thermoanaerobaculia bacterium]|jgi:hypothetical protein|nr:hypothetical protein [Thermoanaerobaculia bacterium]
MKQRTCVTFDSNFFNTTVQKPEFAHSDNFGDDVARWLMSKLRGRGVPVDETDPSQEDHGWYVTFETDGKLHDVVAIYAPDADAARWLLSVERSLGIIGTIFGRRPRSVANAAVELIDAILQSSPEVTGVRWLRYDDVQKGNLDIGAPTPFA